MEATAEISVSHILLSKLLESSSAYIFLYMNLSSDMNITEAVIFKKESEKQKYAVSNAPSVMSSFPAVFPITSYSGSTKL